MVAAAGACRAAGHQRVQLVQEDDAAWRLRSTAGLVRQGQWLLTLLVLQLITGLSNVVLGWPLLGAVLHTGGASALVVVLVWSLALSCTSPTPNTASGRVLKESSRPAA